MTLRQAVLVIDDEEAVREAVTDILALADLPVLAVANGAAGVALLAQRRVEIGLIILDMSMPGLNGLETLTQLREIDQEVPVLLSSGYSKQEFNDLLGSNEKTGYLQKPYNLQQLIEVVKAFLNKDKP